MTFLMAILLSILHERKPTWQADIDERIGSFAMLGVYSMVHKIYAIIR